MWNFLNKIGKTLFGSENDRILKSFKPIVDKISSLEDSMKSLSDSEIIGYTEKLKTQYKQTKNLDEILPEAFALIREAASRTIKQRHYDVQLLGGIALHKGMISEMKTGEGKTLVSTAPAYLNALTGNGVHIITVNDYLAKRDAEWMSQIYTALGISVGCIQHSMSDDSRKAEYNKDITYGTNNEFGFDYLRDNMKFNMDELVQRPFNYAIVDEVDSILIDEARTPLIISGSAEDSSHIYRKANNIITNLIDQDYKIDEKHKSVTLTEEGTDHIEQLLVQNNIIEHKDDIYNANGLHIMHCINQVLKAYKIFKKDVDYVVKDGSIIIIDEFTGRLMEGRRYSEGLHQAIESKENVKIQNENQTLASITFQNYFRMYPKLAGMTGTAMSEAKEFQDIYSLNVLSIPTHVPVQRIDEDDVIYSSIQEKYNAIIREIVTANAKKQPVLVGTTSIEKSEYIASLLKKKNIPHNVLNAKHHMDEAKIIAGAGAKSAVTIATNMAGRGTDIMLGGNPNMVDNSDTLKEEVKKAGGLLVIGTERHDSRRIDDQLRGRSGRQGDPGRTKFFLSLEDDLMRIFGSDKIKGFLQTLGLKDNEAIEHPWINKSVMRAQNKIEAHNFDMRKSLLKYDDVMNEQRKIVYQYRKDIMNEEDLEEMVTDTINESIENIVGNAIPENSYIEKWDIEGLEDKILAIFNNQFPVHQWAQEEGIADKEITERLQTEILEIYHEKIESHGKDIMIKFEKQLFLIKLDQLWKSHLLQMDHLKKGISLRSYGQKDPLVEYKKEAFVMFNHMLLEFSEAVVQGIFTVKIISSSDDEIHKREMRNKNVILNKNESGGLQNDLHGDPKFAGTKRNAPCPCGSNLKFKHCHGKIS